MRAVELRLTDVMRAWMNGARPEHATSPAAGPGHAHSTPQYSGASGWLFDESMQLTRVEVPNTTGSDPNIIMQAASQVEDSTFMNTARYNVATPTTATAAVIATGGIMATQTDRLVNQGYKPMPKLTLGDPSMTLQAHNATNLLTGIADTQGFMQLAGPGHRMPRGIQDINNPQGQLIPPIPWAPASQRTAGLPLQMGSVAGHAAVAMPQTLGHSSAGGPRDGMQVSHGGAAAGVSRREP